jgi:hypothetical protein
VAVTQTPPPGSISDADVARVEELARALLTFLRHRPGQVAAVSVRVPRGSRDTASALAARLADFGMAGVVVHVHYGDGEAHIVSVEFDR